MLLHRQSLTAYGAPLCESVVDASAPQGTQVLVRITRCGVCHSDLHMQDGYFLLGDGKQLDVRSGRTLPFTLGHEIAGTIESAGADAKDATPGRSVAVYPWIGCGQCAACKAGEENICAAPRHLGITVDGGYATHELIPHPRYLIDYAPLSASYAGALMCSGLTAYSALKRLADRAARAPLLLAGLGGVGLMIDCLGIDRRRIGLGGLVLAHALLEALQPLGDIAHHVGEAPLAEQQQDDEPDDQPMPNAETTHVLESPSAPRT